MGLKEFLLGTPTARTAAVPTYKGSVQEWLPIADARDGVLVMKDGRYVKILEVLPTNFHLKSADEQASVIGKFYAYLKIAPNALQIRVLTQKMDVDAYMERMWAFYDAEDNEKCREMIEDNVNLVHYLAHHEAITRRFFLVFQLEPHMELRGGAFRDVADRLRLEAETARQYLGDCGLEAVEWDDPDDAVINLFYGLLNKNAGKTAKLAGKTKRMLGETAFETEGGGSA
jgi:hypothetical protein